MLKRKDQPVGIFDENEMLGGCVDTQILTILLKIY